MKRWIVALGLLALCTGPTFAGGFGLFGGVLLPDDTDEPAGVGLKAQFNASPHVDFQIRVSVFEEAETSPTPEVFQLEITPVDLGFNWDFGEESRSNPYVGLGVTYWILDFSADTTVFPDPVRGRGVDSDGEFGVYAEVGIEWDLNQTWMIFAEAVFRTGKAEAEGDDLGTFLDQDVTLTGAAGHLGLALRW
jgi:hypothetical protein